MAIRICETPEDLTIKDLQDVLGQPSLESFSAVKIGTGQIGSVFRLNLKYSSASLSTEQPPSVILKLASVNPVSRAAGRSLALYDREVKFYLTVAPTLLEKSTKCLSRCFGAAYDPDTATCTLLLSDAGEKAAPGDDIAGATIEMARSAMNELGHIHGTFLGRSPELESAPETSKAWLNRESPLSPQVFAQLFDGFRARYATRLTPEHLSLCEKLVNSYDGYAALVKEKCVMGLVHGDYRLDNMLFTASGEKHELTIVDWQTVSWGPLAADVAYFLGCALKLEDRRIWMDELLQLYCNAVVEKSGDASLFPIDKLKDNVRWQTFFGVFMAIVSSMLAERTDRGDDMFMVMLARHCQLALDLEAEKLLPEPTVQVPLVPKEEDELRHPTRTDANWNESWYFDFIDEAQGLAGWFRLGLTPNRKGNWYTAAITRRGKPTVIIADFCAPEVGDDLMLKNQSMQATHGAEVPLQKYRITVSGAASSYDQKSCGLDASATPGDSRADIDLTFETHGKPYQYRITTRYEIPCLVTGTITVDGEKQAVKAVPGQRDHSWGPRDWWSMDWVWSSFHSHDGQGEVHAIEVHIPGAPKLSVGYIQQTGNDLVELADVDCDSLFDEDGSAKSMLMRIKTKGWQEVVLDVLPQGHAGVRLVSDEGKVSMFERAWCKISRDDGTTGVGWVEWNRNVASSSGVGQ